MGNAEGITLLGGGYHGYRMINRFRLPFLDCGELQSKMMDYDEMMVSGFVKC